MPTLTVNATPHHYQEAGQGSPVLLVHAGIADLRMWDDVWPAFSGRHRSIRFDLRGYGETPLPDGPFVYAADAAGLLAELGVARAHVVGVSMGANMSLDLARRIPNARLEVMPGVAHLPPMEAPDAFSRLVLDFLAG
jgi:pimeloyl-ACP methyl ester carboxylesterase